VLYYYLGDHVLYLAYKIVRRDLHHWVPLEGAASVVESILVRFAIKAIADFTGVVQFRAPGEMGGAAWVFSQGMALVASLVATNVYLSSGKVTDSGEATSDSGISNSGAWAVVGTLTGSWIIFFGCFLFLMKNGYKHTFFSLKTGNAWVQGRYLRGASDEEKSKIFNWNRKKWLAIRGAVKLWTVENWERWEDEKPEWFGENFQRARLHMDEDMIPARSLNRMKGEAGGRPVQRISLNIGNIKNIPLISTKNMRAVTPVQGGKAP
jgi:hypothetical protein